MKTLTLTYSENFRKNEKASKVYGLLRDNNITPLSIGMSHGVARGVTRTYFYLDKDVSKEKLEKILKRFKFQELIIE